MFIDPLLKLMAEKNASDLFISAGAPISIKILDTIMPVNQTIIDGNLTQKIAEELMDERQTQAFEKDWEMNFSHVLSGVGRFRVNVFRQRSNIGLVIRYLRSGTPGIEKLGLPKMLKDLVLEKRGFVLVHFV